MTLNTDFAVVIKSWHAWQTYWQLIHTWWQLWPGLKVYTGVLVSP